MFLFEASITVTLDTDKPQHLHSTHPPETLQSSHSPSPDLCPLSTDIITLNNKTKNYLKLKAEIFKSTFLTHSPGDKQKLRM